jgi:hypothetical protein
LKDLFGNQGKTDMTALTAARVSNTTNEMEVVHVDDADDCPAAHQMEEQQAKQEQFDNDNDDDDDSYRSGNASQSSPSAYTDSTRTGRKKGNSSDNPLDFDIARKENQAVVMWKVVVISVMVLITIGASVAVFVYVDSKEQYNFEDNFEDDALKIFSDLGKNVIQRFGQLDGLVTAMVSYTNVSGNTDWPFVTVPNHAVSASKARTTTGAVAIENFYYIEDSGATDWKNNTRQGWEQYTREQGDQWVNQALAVQEVDDSYFGASLPDNVVAVEHGDIWYGSEVVPESSGP